MTLDVSLNLLALVLSGAMAAMLAAVLRWFASPTAQAHYRHWAAAWVAQSAYYLIGATSFALGVLSTVGPVPRFVLSSATQTANVMGAALLVVGAVGYVHRREFSARQLRQLLLLSLVVGTAVAAISLVPEWRSTRQIFRGAVSAASFLACGLIVRRHRSALDRPGRFLSLSMIGFGLMHVHYVLYAVLSAIGLRPPFSLGYLTLIDVGWITVIVTTMIALAFADQKEEGAAALRRRESEFRQMIEHSTDLVMILDQALMLRYVSPSTVRLLGWSDAVLGQSLATFTHPDDQALLARDASHASGSDGSTLYLRLRHQSGNWARVEAVVSRTTDQSAVPLLIINARDITERERFEATLRESQKLESVGRLAGGIAHDLNNILTIIGGNAELGLIDATEPVRDSLRQISQATSRASDITRQLLTFARRQVVAPRRFDAWEAVRSTTDMARRLLPESIALRVRSDASTTWVCADPGQLGQVLMNLILNARDAIAGSGTIDVELGTDMVVTPPEPGARPGDYVTITVRDSGSGIPEHVRSHLFEPFFTTKALGAGTGLGLATSYGLVRQAGGFIRVESVVGAGSSFCIYLPVSDAAPAPEEVVASMDAVRTDGHERVLVVEDEPAVRELMVGTLTRLGYDVRAAVDGAQAIQLVDDGARFDVLITDVIMPNMSGVELTRALRARALDVGVVMVSGYPGDTDFLHALPPRTSFLQKPFQAAELGVHVRRVLASASGLDVPPLPALTPLTPASAVGEHEQHESGEQEQGERQ